ncbi:hypothetical protein CU098_013824 [Rhizopus stolonifer]|uniref:Uncharacterized protein n=1 Tax=Rhizopus stolonifer TaxID=4846 RepID=A0A367KWZ8_RHIST|nr:hypothetical protein CU098_013824 [Rhizopus stolonifer]
MLSSRIPASPIIMQQRLSPPQPTASTSLDHLWSKQEKFDSLELRLLALEDSERRFEYRLQLLEQGQPMKPDQQEEKEKKEEAKDYVHLYHALLEEYNSLRLEYKEKEMYYQKTIDELTCSLKNEKEHQDEPFYREEDGYLIFDSTNMNGEITHCRVKIPSHNNIYRKQQQQQQQDFLVSPPTTHIGSPQYLVPIKKGLNPHAPEWKKKRHI